MSQVTDFDQLMADVMAGSEEAVWKLAESYSHHIVRVIRLSLPSQLRSKLDSQDLVQTLWASVLLHRADLTRLKSPDELIAYLARAAKNKVIDKTRHFGNQKRNIKCEEKLKGELQVGPKRFRGHRHQALYSRDLSPSTVASLREQWNLVMSTSSDRDREVVRLTLKGYTFDAIAKQLAIDEKTARRAIYRMIEQITG